MAVNYNYKLQDNAVAVIKGAIEVLQMAVNYNYKSYNTML